MKNLIDDTEIHSLFNEIIKTPSPSGFEYNVQKVLFDFMTKYSDQVYYDVNHNLIAIKRGTTDNSIMVSAHVDEVGMMVKYIDENGYIYFSPISNIDACVLPGMKVVISHDNELTYGVIGRKPIHFLSEHEKGIVNMEDLWIDIGELDVSVVKNKVHIGDVITFDSSILLLSDDIISTRSADNKISVLAICSTMKLLNKISTKKTICFVVSVQEEIGYRGIQTAVFAHKPEEAIILDVTHATDHPKVNKIINGDVKLKGGTVVTFSPDVNLNLSKTLINIAKEKQIKYQIDIKPRITNTETSSVQLSGRGVCTALVSIPIRYMHSPNELFSISDFMNTINLIYNFLECR